MLTIKEAIGYSGLSDSTIRQYLRDGLLTRYKRGKKIILIDEKELDALVKEAK